MSILRLTEKNTESDRYVTLNGGEYDQIINHWDDCGYTNPTPTTDYLGENRYYVDNDGNVITDAETVGYDILSFVRIVPGYTVSFKLNGNGTDFTKTVLGGYRVDRPTDPNVRGLLFDDWYTETGSRWSFLTDRVTRNMTLNAGFRVMAPVFSPDDRNDFTDTVNVTITARTEGADIYYTTDGTTPTKSSTKYTGPITLTDTATIRAFAVKDGFLDSGDVQITYTKSGVTTSDTSEATTPAEETTTATVAETTEAVTTTAPVTEEKTDENPATSVTLSFTGIIISAAGLMLAAKNKRK